MLINIIFEIIAFVALAVFNIFALKKCKVLERICVSAIQYIPLIIISILFGIIGREHMNYFALLIAAPFVLLWLFRYMGLDGLKYLDAVTPAYPLALAVSKVGCFFARCCNGIEAEYGIYNIERNIIEAPVQLIEAFNALLIFMFFMCYRKFAKKGSCYPIFVILYSATRFFSEFLRVEKDVLWIFKAYHFFCLAGIVIGVAELVLVSRNREKLGKLLGK